METHRFRQVESSLGMMRRKEHGHGKFSCCTEGEQCVVDLWLHQIGLSQLPIVLMVERAKLGPSKSGKHFRPALLQKPSTLKR